MDGESASNFNWDAVEGDCVHCVLSEGSTLHTALYILTGIEMKASDMTTVTREMGLPFRVVAQNS